MEQQDYYQILGVEQDATSKQIKDAYRKLALQYHPDRNHGNPDSGEKMKAVNEAYAVLSDPQKRQEYDLMRQRFGSSAYSQFRQTYSEQDIFSGSDINRIFEEMARSFGLRGFDEIFKEFYGQGHQNFEFNKDGLTGRGFVFTFPSGRNSHNTTQFPGLEKLGKIPRYILKKISGIELPEDGRSIKDVIRLSPEQARQGGSYPYYLREKSKKLVVKIPPGVRDGQKIRLSEMGEDGKGGGTPGDLYLKVRFKKPLIQKMKDFISDIRSSS